MNKDTSYFEIDHLKIEWGKPLNEVRSLLEDVEQFAPYGGWPNIRCRCSSVYGLAAKECEIRAPFEDRPTLQVHYEIAPIPTVFFEKMNTPFLKQMEKALGKPYKTENLYTQPDLRKENLPGIVVFSAKWLIDGIRVSLSVYGAVRNNDSGPAAAGIFIDYLDEVEISKPFRKRTEAFENRLAKLITKDIDIKTFKLQHAQKPFRIADHNLEDPHLAEKDMELRAAQLALYRRELYQTPAAISSKLKANEIGYYEVAELDKIFISNKWDTTFLKPGQYSELTFWDILPARGPGRRELDLKELNIEDAKGSLILLDLVAQIEKDTGQKIEMRIAYDD